ncbi:M10 family metallopeptidase C-terminal domain-containing protein [Pseudomonas sp. nanlin1]|uniref:M10 family metallopeptidase C-terminal domain-containing protein n=1 Tax=Pseudomonas sp. nanlin1 TaxID=3040605 RepID=UPI00388FB07B
MSGPLSTTPYSYAYSFSSRENFSSLLYGIYWSPSGSGTTQLTYSFLSDNSYFARDYSADDEPDYSYTLTAGQESAAVSALASWSAVANLQFTQVTDSTTTAGDLRFGGYYFMDLDSAAWAYMPGSGPSAGDVWIGPNTNVDTPSAGSYDYMTFVHEIGHALGLKHPFETSWLNRSILRDPYDDARYTLMSYTNDYSYSPTTPMLLDIQAIQYLYGANMAYNAGDTSYSWAPEKSVFETIWDGGGNDTIDASNQAASVRINLNEGEFSKIGQTFLNYNTSRSNPSVMDSGLAIAYGAKIENAIGSAFADILIGNALNNVLDGGAGRDTLIGGRGDDTYIVDQVDEIALIKELVNEGSDTLAIGYSNTADTAIVFDLASSLPVNVENLTVLGTGLFDVVGNRGDNTLTGNASSNTLSGGAGNDRLDGGGGADNLVGGVGNDIYIIDELDTLIELADEGIDEVRVAFDYTLADHFENGLLLGDQALNLTGNDLDNSLVGNTAANVLQGGLGNDVLDGAAGADRLIGGMGDDTYVVDDAADEIVENEGEGTDLVRATINYTLAGNVENGLLLGNQALTLTGNSLANVLTGNAGANVLDGGTGADRMVGGDGNDTYIVDDVGDVVIETDFNYREVDTVKASISYTLAERVENLILTGSGHINGTGNSASNRITGNAGDNILDGGWGSDTLIGGAGNDTYIVNSIWDIIQENAQEGNDTVMASLDWTLAANLENLTLTGSDNLKATGNNLANSLTGNVGNNILDGGLGADSMAGGKGNDTYVVDQSNDVIVELADEGTDLVRSSVSYTLGNHLENAVLLGASAINLTGNDLANTLTGNAAANVLDGGRGADTLIGGLGNDTYVVDNVGDVIIETSTLASENDTVRASLNWTLGANLENLTLTGSDDLTGTGNALNNLIIGNAGNNWLDGGKGNDTLAGGLGDDTYVLDSANDTVLEEFNAGIDEVRTGFSYTLGNNIENATLTGPGALALTGNALANTLTGNSAANTLDGGAGADTLIGGAGNDTYIVDNSADVIIESSTLANEIDNVLASASYGLSANLENLTLTGTTSIDGTGNALANRITGNAGNNVLDGGAGIDTLIGGLGNDTYVVDNLRDVIVESSALASEIDTVQASLSWTLGANLENLTLTGSDNLNATGNALANILVGNDGNNTLDGKAGIDTLAGGLGDDTYIVDRAEELALLTELSDEGTDTLRITYANPSRTTANTVDLNDASLRNVENVTLLGAGLFNVVGNDLANTLTGNASANTLDGGAGDDLLDGGAGADTLIGGTGDDIYLIENAGDRVIEADSEGTDLVRTAISYTLADNVENGLLLGAGALNLTGNALANTLTGNAAANILNGGAGIDTLIGGLGNDTYVVDNADDVIIEDSALAREVDTVMASVSWTLGSNLENLTLTGTTSIDGTGNALANRITGNTGNNVLDGGAGIDTLIGGLGNDTYVVDNLRDVIVESSALAGEIDTVRASLSWSLGANLENLTLTGSDNLNATGNALANILTGNDGNNTLDGKAGIDTLAGGLGDDTYIVDRAEELALLTELSGEGTDTLRITYANASRTTANTVDLNDASLRNLENVTLLGAGLFNVVGNDLANTLTGNASANTLDGGAGDDLLDGGAGADTLIGGAGDDIYLIENAGDRVIEADSEGTDLVRTAISYTLADNVENGLLLGAGALNLTGNALANTLTGNAAANTLNGAAGADTLIGGLGNDTYVVDDINDVIVEDSALLREVDTVMASVSWTLGSNLENLTLTGSNNLDGTGNALANRITGNAGNNVLDGGAGIDTLIGGLGNDTYVVDNLRDVIVESSALASEIDTVQASLSWTLGANLENLTLTGSDNLNATGNALANILTGNDGNNTLDGKAGIDTLAGGLGDDTYIVDRAEELALLTELSDEGTDTLRITYANASRTTANSVDLNDASLRNIENVTLLGAGLFNVVGNDLANTLTGNASANTLDGGAGDDLLDGGAGADTLIGGAGDDIYLIENAGDRVIEADSEGTDLVRTAISYTLTDNVENGLLLGAGALNLNGNALANTLTGNAAANILNGGAGIDTLIGGLGNDTYVVDNADDVIIEDSALLREVDTVMASVSWTLGSNLENLTLTGSNNLDGTGNALANRITGNAGNNVLDGGTGIDTLIGGLGNDTYVVDDVRDIVSETNTLASEIDLVRASVNWTLGANLENLTLTGSDNLNATGNALANILTGNDGNNILDGKAGIDTFAGGLGDDTYIVDRAEELALLTELSDEGNDTLRITYANPSRTTANTVDLNDASLRNLENVTLLGAGLFNVVGNNLANTLTGNASVNTLDGGAGDDLLDGGAGADTLIGGTGDDIYLIENAGDRVIEADSEGTDLVRTAISYTLTDNVENGLLLGAGALSLTGNALANTLTGNAGANILNGGAGIDTLIGGLGNDTYVVDDSNDVIIETSTLAREIDTVLASASYELSANLENLTLTGLGNLDGRGNALANLITGNAGNNLLDGGAGADTLVGGLGNDIYVVDNLKDTIVERSTLASEIDSVQASVSWTLGANLENLTLTGNEAINGTGNALANELVGNDASNTLSGGVGNDTLSGGGGDDTLIGGLGRDMLTGGTGADRFVFNALAEMGKGDQRDVITDFDGLAGDKLDFSRLDANVLTRPFDAFSFIGSDAFTAAGQLRFFENVLYGNVNGNLDADFEIQLLGVSTFNASQLIA